MDTLISVVIFTMAAISLALNDLNSNRIARLERELAALRAKEET